MDLLTHDKDRLHHFYLQQINKNGNNTFGGVGWTSEMNQKVRFAALCDIGDLNGKTILDVGCGFGEFYKILSLYFHDFTYTGLDILPEMVNQAKANYPDLTFLEGNFANMEIDKYDYIFASGSLTFMVNDYKNFYFNMIKKMFDHANIGIGFNMLDILYHSTDNIFATYSLPEVHDFCLTLTDKVKTRKDYLIGDFTVYLYH